MISSRSWNRLLAVARLDKKPAGSLTLALAVGLFGCASPGVPRPPSLHLPATVTDLTARRVGDRVELQWTAPARTTDGLDLTNPTTVEICRDPVQTRPHPAQPDASLNGPEYATACSPLMKLTGHAGVSTATDPLPPDLTASTGEHPLIAYRVRILNAAGRSAPPSPPALVPGGFGLSPPLGFRAAQTRGGVVLEWQKSAQTPNPTGPEGTVEVVRSQQKPPSEHSSPPAATPAIRQKHSKSHSLSLPSPVRRNDQADDIRLRQDSAPPISSTQEATQAVLPDKLDGMIDRTALQGAVYSYTAQRVLRVPGEGKPLELRSEPTTPLVIAMRDTFPPAAPTGLVSVPGTQLPSTDGAGAQISIDLAWRPNTEADLAGYLVYRWDQPSESPNDARGTRLTPLPIAGSAFRDTTVSSGHHYLYRVTAVDRNGNESALSAPVTETPNGR